ncbi:hypothetical protein VE02_06967 [Pseudogymnoascus sp. 03VT05]|nr:hypothetical protein VE02_06967 [Pseudogymnoascus sp. 03VT05]
METLRHTISELRRSLKALMDSEIDSASNHQARLQFEKTNSYAVVYIPKEEWMLQSLEMRKLQEAMQNKISTCTLAVNAVPVCPPRELCGLDEAERSSLTDALEMKSWTSRHPFLDLEPADLLRLTPYYLPCYLVFPPGYLDQYVKKATQDYQMQQDLLEVQNKKSLMMARQAQDEASMYKAANTGVTNPPSEPLQWVHETGANFEGRSPDGSTDESEYESA